MTKDIPDNSVVVGTPVKVIGTFDDYLKKYMSGVRYPDELKPRHQTVSAELAKYMWDEFDKEYS